MRLAVLGDIHRCFDEVDVRTLDALGYDAVLVVGDLGDTLHRGTLDVARAIAFLKTPVLFIPGNHDGTSPWGVLCEALGVGLRRPGMARRQRARMQALEDAFRPVEVLGFCVRQVGDVSIVVARPWAMDGRRACFAEALRDRHGVGDLVASAQRLKELVDAAPTDDLVFLAHNGPAGLGHTPDAPWAIGTGRDVGDPDLAEAIAYAAGSGKRVLACVAGHVHWGKSRRWQVRGPHDALYVNAARVPRRKDGTRWHVALTVADGRARAEGVAILSGKPLGYLGGPS